MSIKESPEWPVVIEPSGRVVLPAGIMAEIVMETAGCRLWYNEKSSRLGVRLLRGDDSPPFFILRIKTAGGAVMGAIEAEPFFNRVGIKPNSMSLTCGARYFPKYHLLEIQLPEKPSEIRPDEGDFFDVYQPLED